MQTLKILKQKKRKNLLVSVNGAVKRSKYFLKLYDLDGGLYPDLQSCGRILASLIELKASDIWEAGRVVEDLRRFLRVAPWLSRWMLGAWLWILEDSWLEKGRVREDGCLEEVRGCNISGCLNGYGGWKDRRSEYRGGCWK